MNTSMTIFVNTSMNIFFSMIIFVNTSMTIFFSMTIFVNTSMTIFFNDYTIREYIIYCTCCTNVSVKSQ